jgi:hypothetical protein
MTAVGMADAGDAACGRVQAKAARTAKSAQVAPMAAQIVRTSVSGLDALRDTWRGGRNGLADGRHCGRGRHAAGQTGDRGGTGQDSCRQSRRDSE